MLIETILDRIARRDRSLHAMLAAGGAAELAQPVSIHGAANILSLVVDGLHRACAPGALDRDALECLDLVVDGLAPHCPPHESVWTAALRMHVLATRRGGALLLARGADPFKPAGLSGPPHLVALPEEGVSPLETLLGADTDPDGLLARILGTGHTNVPTCGPGGATVFKSLVQRSNSNASLAPALLRLMDLGAAPALDALGREALALVRAGAPDHFKQDVMLDTVAAMLHYGAHLSQAETLAFASTPVQGALGPFEAPMALLMYCNELGNTDETPPQGHLPGAYVQLAALGLDIDRVWSSGHTLLDKAIERKLHHVAAALLACGADPRRPGKDGVTPEQLARAPRAAPDGTPTAPDPHLIRLLDAWAARRALVASIERARLRPSAPGCALATDQR